jgi:hypothetical protein
MIARIPTTIFLLIIPHFFYGNSSICSPLTLMSSAYPYNAYAGEEGNAKPAPIPMKPTARPTWYPVIVAAPNGQKEITEVAESLKPAHIQTMRGRGIMMGGSSDPTPWLPTLQIYLVILVVLRRIPEGVFSQTDGWGCIPAHAGGATVFTALMTSWDTQAVSRRAVMNSCFSCRVRVLNG